MSEFRVSRFEKSLFDNGTLAVEEDGTVSNPYIQRNVEHWEKDDYFADAGKAWRVWLIHFNGKLPSHWGEWWGPRDDLKQADEEAVDLSQILKDAAVAHPNIHIADSVSKYQKLDEMQIALLFCRPLPGAWSDKETVRRRRLKGVDQDTINQAEFLQDRIMAHRLRKVERTILLERFSSPIQLQLNSGKTKLFMLRK